MKVVVHVEFPETGRRGAGLKDITNILKEAPDAQVDVIGHGAGIGPVEKARAEHAEAVGAVVKEGMKFVACEVTMRQESIRKDYLPAGLVTVPSEAVEGARKQQKDGFADFKP